MNELKINLSDCMLGNVLSKDVLSHNDLKLAEKNTIINNFIKYKLIKLDVQIIWIYDVSGWEYENIQKTDNHKTKVCYKECINSLQTIFEDLDKTKPLEFSELIDISKLVYKNINNVDCIIKYLHEIKEDENNYILFHSINVSFYAMLIGKWMSMPKAKILDLILAGLFHDIGKLRIPEHILNKKGSLTTEEFKIMEGHTTLGYDLLKNLLGLKEDIKKSILMHHERIDGSGYPKGVNGDSIGECARIVAIADVYDAMTTNRIYKKRVNPFEAFQMLLGTGMNILESSKINVFILNLSSHILGVRVNLDNGEFYQVANDSPNEALRSTIPNKLSFEDFSIDNQHRFNI